MDALARCRVDGLDGFDFVVEEHHAEALVSELSERSHDIDRIAVHAERCRFQFPFRARVERLDKLIEEMFVTNDLSHLDADGRGMEIRRIAGTVKTGDARYDDDVAPSRKQGRHGA